MTTDVGVPGGGRARDPIISLTKRRPAEAFKRTRPAARRDPRRRRNPGVDIRLRFRPGASHCRHLQ
jgi:hypothetical protein